MMLTYVHVDLRKWLFFYMELEFGGKRLRYIVLLVKISWFEQGKYLFPSAPVVDPHHIHIENPFNKLFYINLVQDRNN